MELAPGEAIVRSWAANRTSSKARAQGGKLHLTDRRLIFRPHIFDRLLRGREWEVALDRVVGVGIEPRSGNPLGGGLRNRLRIEDRDGHVQLFVVNKLDDVVDEISRGTGTVARS